MQFESQLGTDFHKNMSGVTLDELLEEVDVSPAQLDKACTSEHLRDIALFLDSWRTVAPYLELSKVQVEQVERDGTEENEKRLKFLESWKGNFAFKAKYIVLVKALLKISRADQAEQVCRVLVQQPEKGIPCLWGGGGSTHVFCYARLAWLCHRYKTYIYGYALLRALSTCDMGGGTGPADPATAGPMLALQCLKLKNASRCNLRSPKFPPKLRVSLG